MISELPNERLTRQEISWLLAQEARGAAKSLREDMSRLTSPPAHGLQDDEQPPSVQTTLDALDDAIGMLSVLQTHRPPSASRRGRIDLAALVCDVAPEARIAMSPGQGTEVFGDEHDLRRVLHMLLSQTNNGPSGVTATSSPDVEIRRDGDLVKISVELGPDSSATAELERRWLSRMALQHGGQLSLEGGRQTLSLPADGASDQREVVKLRKELEEAQQLGEAYARELATAFAADFAPSPPSVPPPAQLNVERFASLVGVARGIERSFRGIVDGLKEDAKQAKSELGEGSTLAARLSERAIFAQDRLRSISQVAACPPVEDKTSLDLMKEVRSVIEGNEHWASRRAVTLEVDGPDDMTYRTHKKALRLMIDALIDHALMSTPQGKKVSLKVERTQDGAASIRVIDGGPAVPRQSREDLLRNATDPTSLGRPGGISLLVANLAAGRLAGSLVIGETQDGRTCVDAALPAD